MADHPIEAGRAGRPVSWTGRILGPLALIAVVIAVIVVISSSGSMDEGGSSVGAGATGSSKSDKKKDGPETPKTYTVEAGDSLSSIAAKFGVSVKRLERLNPDVDPQALSGELKLR